MQDKFVNQLYNLMILELQLFRLTKSPATQGVHNSEVLLYTISQHIKNVYVTRSGENCPFAKKIENGVTGISA